MPRWKSTDWDVISSLHVDKVMAATPDHCMYINPTGTATITAPVTRDFFERVASPTFGPHLHELVIWDQAFDHLYVKGAIAR